MPDKLMSRALSGKEVYSDRTEQPLALALFWPHTIKAYHNPYRY